MLTINTFIKRHPVLIYYSLTFTISWGGILIVVGPDGIPGTGKQIDTLIFFVLSAFFAGPSLAGLVLTGLVDGRAGFRGLLLRMTKWRVGGHWYAVAVLSAPLLLMLILLPLSLLFPEFIPGILTRSDKATWLLISIISGLIGGGFLEELGWTGFALPKLRLRYTAFHTGLIMGLLWGAWHLLITLWMSGTSSGVFSLAIFLPGMLFHIVSLTAYRVLMVWVYDRTGSLLVAMLMHTSLSASRGILNPVGLSLSSALAYDLIVAAALWIVVAAGHRKQTLTRQAREALPG